MIHAVGSDSPPANQPDTLAQLISDVGQGNEDSFRELYDRIAGWVYGLALRVVRDPAQSEEVAQEVLLEIWRQAPKFNTSKGSGKGWVMTMTHRRAVDRVRSAQARLERDVKDAERSYQPARDSVPEEVALRLDQERVRRHLADLTAVQRQAIELAYFKGYTQREVSVALDIPLGTVKTRMRDGLIRLRDAMEVTP
jgi:RNA polymerase sigma-70 factor (ECF subfamily)